MLSATQGENYKSTSRSIEKKYEVKQSFGKNILTLKTKTLSYYNEEGLITYQVIYKGNLTYLGKIEYNYGKDPKLLETKYYNYMNLPYNRKAVYYGENPLESTEMEYDSKGNISQKTVIRLYDKTQDRWQLNYGQLGYIYTYEQVFEDSSRTVLRKDTYDYFDEPLMKSFNIYDDDHKLVENYSLNASDSLISRTIFVYGETGDLLEENHYDSAGDILQTNRYYYDDQGRIIQKNLIYWNPRFGVTPRLREQYDYEYF